MPPSPLRLAWVARWIEVASTVTVLRVSLHELPRCRTHFFEAVAPLPFSRLPAELTANALGESSALHAERPASGLVSPLREYDPARKYLLSAMFSSVDAPVLSDSDKQMLSRSIKTIIPVDHSTSIQLVHQKTMQPLPAPGTTTQHTLHMMLSKKVVQAFLQ